MVPLVVVTGFLGAGKTTLVNRLLARRAAEHADKSGERPTRSAAAGGAEVEKSGERPTRSAAAGGAEVDKSGERPTRSAAAGGAEVSDKIGVIVNELGAIGIDGALLGGESARQVELPGGCVCCALGDKLDATLIELVERTPDLSAIVLETTGVAEPIQIAWAVRKSPVDRYVRLAVVVTVVDAANFRASRAVTTAVDAQVAYADVVLISKGELAGAAEVAAVVREVELLAPKAMIRRGTTEQHARWLEEILVDPNIEPVPVPEPAPHEHDDACRHTDSHAHGVDSVSIELSGAMDVEELEEALGELPASYVRIKGIARATDGGWFAFHRVGLRVSIEPLAGKPPGLGDRGRLVALGRELDPAVLTACVTTASRG